MRCEWHGIVCFSMTPKPDAIWLTDRGPTVKPLQTPSPGSRAPAIWLTVGRTSKIREAAQRHIRPTRQRDDVRIRQGGEFIGVAIARRTAFEGVKGRRMEIDLCQTARQIGDQPAE